MARGPAMFDTARLDRAVGAHNSDPDPVGDRPPAPGCAPPASTKCSASQVCTSRSTDNCPRRLETVLTYRRLHKLVWRLTPGRRPRAAIGRGLPMAGEHSHRVEPQLQIRRPPVSFNGTSVGLDVHALSVVAHAVDEETGRVERARLCPDHSEILGWLHRLGPRCEWLYEAGPPRPGGLRRDSRRRNRCHRDRGVTPRCRLVRGPRRHRSAGAIRQRLLLPISRLARCLC